MFDNSKEHLKEIEMSYWQHFWFALGLIPFFLFATVFSIIHAIIPGFFPDTVSSIVEEVRFKLSYNKNDSNYSLNQDDKC